MLLGILCLAVLCLRGGLFADFQQFDPVARKQAFDRICQPLLDGISIPTRPAI